MAAAGEQPLGVAAIAPEPPELGARGLSVGARLLCGATTFFFVSFFFAYFYLRSLNQEHMWKPHHVKPEQGLGAAFVACIVLSAAATFLGGRRMKRGERAWLGLGVAGLVLGLVAAALQCITYTRQHFGPTDGAYASVYCAWTAFYVVAVLGAMFWLETHVASELRARRTPASASEGDIANADLLIAPALDATVFFWTFLAAFGVIMYVTLYLL